MSISFYSLAIALVGTHVAVGVATLLPPVAQLNLALLAEAAIFFD